MKFTTILTLACSLALSSLALAEGGGDRTFDRMVKAREVAMAAHRASALPAKDQGVVQEKLKVEKPHS